MFGWEFPPNITGGLAIACYGIIKSLAKHGIDVIFVVPRLIGGEDNKIAHLISASEIEFDERYYDYFKDYYEKIKCYAIDSPILPYVTPEEFEKIFKQKIKELNILPIEKVTKQKYYFSGKYGPNLIEEVARYSLIASKIAKENPHDIIHCHDWLTYPAGIAAKKISNNPLVIHVHATEFDRCGENINTYVYNIEKLGMEAADKIITVSNHTKNIVIQKYGINPDKVITIYNAIDPYDIEKVKQKKGFSEKLITFLGRITFQKGPEYFVEAAHKLYKKEKNVRFVMAGSGDMLEKMIRLVAYYNMGHKFHFTGFLMGEDVYRLFSMSDVYVMPSVSEPFGISPLEAMISNVPVIISKQSGVSEVLTYAIKVDFWDTDALADAMHALIKYKGIREMFIKYGKEEVINLKWDNNAKKIINEVYIPLIFKRN